jgi:hypothetical protein
MREPQQQQTLPDDEATLVAPRFDDEETLVARPVVPLEGNAPAAPAHQYRSPYAPRRPWTLVLVSVLVGGVLGGAGLYLYQRQSRAPAESPVAAQPTTHADAAQAPAAPAAEGQNTTPPESPVTQTEAPAAAAPGPEETPPPALDEEVTAPAPVREPESVPASERRTAPSGDGEAGTPKRGKKGRRDEELERRPPSRPDGNVARDEEPEARQVDTIFYRQRRAERRAERRAARRARRDGDVDRLRRIFEGTP